MKNYSEIFDPKWVEMGEEYISEINIFMAEHEKLMLLLDKYPELREQYIVTLTARERAENVRAKEYFVGGFHAGFNAAK